MPNVSITPEVISSIVGVIVSLLFSYFPWLRTKFAALTQEARSGIMILLMAVVAVATFYLSCNGIITTDIACDQNGVTQLIYIFIITLTANQGTYLATRSLQPGDVKRAKSG